MVNLSNNRLYFLRLVGISALLALLISTIAKANDLLVGFDIKIGWLLISKADRMGAVPMCADELSPSTVGFPINFIKLTYPFGCGPSDVYLNLPAVALNVLFYSILIFLLTKYFFAIKKS